MTSEPQAERQTRVRPKGTNVVIFVGDLVEAARFAALRGSGLSVCNFEIETMEDLGRDGQRTERHPVAAFGEAAEALRHIPAGTRVLCRGGMRSRKWNRSNGSRAQVYEAIAYYVEVLGAAQRAGEHDPDTENVRAAP